MTQVDPTLISRVPSRSVYLRCIMIYISSKYGDTRRDRLLRTSLIFIAFAPFRRSDAAAHRLRLLLDGYRPNMTALGRIPFVTLDKAAAPQLDQSLYPKCRSITRPCKF